jgi:hypothetical protein
VAQTVKDLLGIVNVKLVAGIFAPISRPLLRAFFSAVQEIGKQVRSAALADRLDVIEENRVDEHLVDWHLPLA